MITVNKLDTSIFSDKVKFVSLGRLDKELIDFITDRRPSYKNILSENIDILFWEDRLKHIERHKNDFMSDSEYEQCLSDIPLIIKSPDYISIHPTDGSISFIRDYSGHASVSIRISQDGKMSFRTMYPIMDAQLSSYIRKGMAWEYKKN